MAKFDIEEAEYRAAGARVAVVAARFNHAVVERLAAAAVQTLARHGVTEVDTVRVPGAFELPLTAQTLAAAGRHAAVIALGAVIRGGTPHFEYVCSECAHGLMHAGLATGVPVIFGVLTCDTRAQADARAGGADGNKGHEAALAALEMITLLRALRSPAP